MSLSRDVFRTLMEPDARKAFDARIEIHRRRVAEVAALSDRALAELVERTVANCEPCRYPKGESVYDATLAHVLIPEVIERLKRDGEVGLCLACHRMRAYVVDGDCVDCRR